MTFRYLVLVLAVLAACGESNTVESTGNADVARPAPETVTREEAGPTVSTSSAPDEPVEALPQPPVQPSEDTPPPAPAEPTSNAGPVERVQEPAPPPAANDAAAVLARAERTYSQLRSLQADFEQEVYVPLLDATRRSRGRIYHRRPDLFAMRFTDPEGDLLIADGRDVWMYYPSTDPRQVMRSSLAAGGQQVDLQREFLSNATQRYDATLNGTETVAGRSAHALTLVPRGPSPYRRIRLWVDVEDALVRRFEIVEENESERRLQMSNLRPNADIPDSIFEFTPPPGAQVFQP